MHVELDLDKNTFFSTEAWPLLRAVMNSGAHASIRVNDPVYFAGRLVYQAADITDLQLSDDPKKLNAEHWQGLQRAADELSKWQLELEGNDERRQDIAAALIAAFTELQGRVKH